jgi:glycosyltransferase involved in cell wall biosynthesis
MYMRRMVIARASGGPLETIANKETGMLCSASPEDWAAAIRDTGMQRD